MSFHMLRVSVHPTRTIFATIVSLGGGLQTPTIRAAMVRGVQIVRVVVHRHRLVVSALSLCFLVSIAASILSYDFMC
jgi:hypothetical protein